LDGRQVRSSSFEEEIMIKTAIFVLTILSTAPFGLCGDLVLRIDMVGFEDVDKDVEKQESELLRRIEAFVEPDRKFRATSRFGLEVMGVSGYAQAEPDGGMKFSLLYRYSKFSPEMAEMIDEFDPKFPLRSSSVKTSVTLLPGNSVMLGGGNSESSSAGNPKRSYSKWELVATLVELEPEQARRLP
jgi:hypothetical protein